MNRFCCKISKANMGLGNIEGELNCVHPCCFRFPTPEQSYDVVRDQSLTSSHYIVNGGSGSRRDGGLGVQRSGDGPQPLFPDPNLPIRHRQTRGLPLNGMSHKTAEETNFPVRRSYIYITVLRMLCMACTKHNSLCL